MPTLVVPKYIFLQILVTFENNNLATSIRPRGWKKVAPSKARSYVKVAPGRVKERNVQLVR